MRSLIQILNKQPIWYILIALAIIVTAIIIYKSVSRNVEGFYPIDGVRIKAGDNGRRRYNDFSETQDPANANVIPEGEQGDVMLMGMLQGAAYEGNGRNVLKGPAAGLNYDEEFPYPAPPEISVLMSRIKKCESYQTWDCRAFDDPEFQKYCGICTVDGQNHVGKKHIGGLYIDQESKEQTTKTAKAEGKKPEYSPTVGICKGEYIVTRPYCDVQKDRYECGKSQSFDDQAVKDKCALCVQATEENKFVYIGGRSQKNANYALNPTKPVEFKVRLRLGIVDAENAKVVVTRHSDQTVIAGGFIAGTNVYIVNIDKAKENEKYNVLVSYPEYTGYNWTAEDLAKIDDMANPQRAKLVRAMYGPNLGDYTKDDPRAIDVSTYLKDKFKVFDCAKTDVVATNDGLGGDPNPGIYKQLRLVYSDNGTDFAYSFTGEGGTSKPVIDANYEKMCPPGVSSEDAQRTVCEVSQDSSPTGRIFTKGNNSAYKMDSGADSGPKKVIFYSKCDYGGKATELTPGRYNFAKLMATGYQNDTLQSLKVGEGLTVTLWEHDIGGGRPLVVTKDIPCLQAQNYMNTVSSCEISVASSGPWCIKPLEKKARGIVGVWESMGHASRYVPLNHSLVSINGFEVGPNGPPTLGTVQGSKYFKTKVPPSKLPNIPNYLFWFWEKNHKSSMCDFTLVVPATLRDTSILEDTAICPTGPLASTPEAAKRLQAGACEKPVAGGPQGPGTYTLDCIKSLYLASSCTVDGKTFPSSMEKAKVFTVDSSTGADNDMDGISYAVQDIYEKATNGADLEGNKIDDDAIEQANQDCFGQAGKDPCDTPFKETGPHTVKCLNYLYKNAGKSNPAIGQTYVGVFNRSSGTDRTNKTPVMYCQNLGSMSPVDSGGQTNVDAVQEANSWGSVANIKEYYRKIHYDANFSTDLTAQKIALKKCYGVGVKGKTPTCKGVKARFVRVMQSMEVPNPHIQIAQLQVFDVYDKNVALRKPTKAASAWPGTSSETVVDGNASSSRPWPIYHDMGHRNWSRAAVDEFWEVDLQNTEEIAYIVYYNRSDCCQHRARGMRVQLLDETGAVIKEKKLTGMQVETLMFSNAKPSALIRIGTEAQFAPGKYLGSLLLVNASGEVNVVKRVNVDNNFLQSIVFVVTAGNDNSGSTISFKHKFSDRFLRVQGFRVRAANNDGSNAFKNETSFIVSESVAGNPGEVSYESKSNSQMYLSVAENMGVYVSGAKTGPDQKKASWRMLPSPI